MPELPEVETIRRDLLPVLRGRAFTHVWVSPDAPRLVQAPPPADFARLLPGRRVEDISRRGKFLVFHLSGGLYLLVHLRMTGALLHRPAGAPPDRYVRAVLSLDDGSELRFSDLRKFGALWLVPDPSTVLGRLGPEPLEGGLTPSLLRELTARRRAPIKSLLLDQRALAGLGNIYADEALFAARLHPQRPAGSLSDSEVEAAARGHPPGADGSPGGPRRQLQRLRGRLGAGGPAPVPGAGLPAHRPALLRLRPRDREGEGGGPQQPLLPEVPAAGAPPTRGEGRSHREPAAS